MTIGGTALAHELTDLLPRGHPNLFHPWKDRCAQDLASNGPAARLERLARHLSCDARWILCGEAPGYQGCRYSGIAFTSERLIAEGAIPRLTPAGRLTRRSLPYSEPSATTVWRVLHLLGIETTTILWNAVQLHPHQPNNTQTNRTPNRDEVALGIPALLRLRAAFPQAKWLAIGKTAEAALNRASVSVEMSVRHPSFGGTSEFEMGVTRAVAR